MTGILFLVSTPIGEPDDLTFRARRVLSEVDVVICEEMRIGSTLLLHLNISKPLAILNEHSDGGQVSGLAERLVRGENVALISDHGTPLIADPGGALVTQALESGIRVVPVPGPSSITSALVSSGLPSRCFRFIGQLPSKTELRRRALREMKSIPETLVLLDAPYRLIPLLRSVREELGESRQIVVACNLTMSDERLVRGTVKQVLEEFEREPFKGEFVSLIQGAKMKNYSKES